MNRRIDERHKRFFSFDWLVSHSLIRSSIHLPVCYPAPQSSHVVGIVTVTQSFSHSVIHPSALTHHLSRITHHASRITHHASSIFHVPCPISLYTSYSTKYSASHKKLYFYLTSFLSSSSIFSVNVLLLIARHKKQKKKKEKTKKAPSRRLPTPKHSPHRLLQFARRLILYHHHHHHSRLPGTSPESLTSSAIIASRTRPIRSSTSAAVSPLVGKGGRTVVQWARRKSGEREKNVSVSIILWSKGGWEGSWVDYSG